MHSNDTKCNIMTPKDNKNSRANLVKRARSKYIARGLAHHLVTGNQESPLKKGYLRTFGCANTILLHQKKLISHYCKNRWCPVCNRIRTAQAICGYKPQLDKFQDAHFVTLTAETVTEKSLFARISEMQKKWQLIIKRAVQTKRKDFKGVRSFECTPRPGGRYHPHYHIIVEGGKNATWLVAQWLKRWKNQAIAKCQDVRKVDEQSYRELFKYATKLSVMQAKGSEKKVAAKALDVIFRALRNRRLFQAFGGIERAPEELEGQLFGQAAFENLLDEKWVWQKIDWIGENTGEKLTGHTPDERVQQLWGSGESDIQTDNPKLYPA